MYSNVWTFANHAVFGSFFHKFRHHGVNIVVSRYPKYRARAPNVNISDIVNEVYTGTRISKRKRSGADDSSYFGNKFPLSANETILSADESPPKSEARRSEIEEPSHFANEPPRFPNESSLSSLPPTTRQTLDVPGVDRQKRRACGSGPELATSTDNAYEAYKILKARFAAHKVYFHVIHVIKRVTTSKGSFWPGAPIPYDKCVVIEHNSSVPSQNIYIRKFKDFAVFIIAPGIYY